MSVLRFFLRAAIGAVLVAGAGLGAIVNLLEPLPWSPGP